MVYTLFKRTLVAIKRTTYKNAQNRGVASTGFIPTPVTRNTDDP